ATLLLLARQLEMRNRTSWARIAAGGAAASLAMAGGLQAGDGVGLKDMVDAWDRAPAAEKEMFFHAAFAVRQVELGLASMLSLFLGLTSTIYGAAFLGEGTYPRWLSVLAMIGGVTAALAGLVMAYSGFSELSMIISMPASLVL